MTAPPPLLSPAEVATYLNVSDRTLTTWRYRKTGPRHYTVGRHVRYRLADIEAWLASQIGA